MPLIRAKAWEAIQERNPVAESIVGMGKEGLTQMNILVISGSRNPRKTIIMQVLRETCCRVYES